MGQGLPKAVTPLVLERGAGPLFQIGLAEMNGWRPGMEDAHVVVVRDTWGFFGVFDGHGGQQCSAFVASRLTEELTNKPMPEDDAALKSLMLRIDKEFLDTEQPSGSTGTFAIVQPPDATEAGEKRVRLRVGNIGDSRVLLGRADGTIVEGPGTDGGLTTDHKPDNETERERIYRTGGTVETIMGVARVNGDLAVSRAFGDAPHKQTGGPNQEDHPVSVEPEFTSLSCDPSDFLMLVCDGISEGNFPNREVVKLAAEELRKNDPAQASAAVCRMALERGSMDNLSCMIVLFSGGEVSGPKKEFLPGPFTAPTHPGFRNAYAAMAERAGMSLEAAVEKRYDAARKERLELVKQRPAKGANDKDAEDVDGDELEGTEDNSLESIRAELTLFDGGPSNALAEGSKERTDWFKSWLDSLEVEPDPQNMSREQLLELAERNPEMLAMAQAHGIVGQNAMRTVRVAAESELKPAMEAHAALRWDERLTAVCGEIGKVLCDDPSDGTSQVKFQGPIFANVWLPSALLTDEDVEDSSEEDVELDEDVELEHVELEYEEVLAEASDAHEDDSEGVTKRALSEPEEDPAKRRRIAPDGLGDLRKQIEHYMSDENLAQDPFFHDKISADPDGWLEAKWFLACDRVQALGVTNVADIESALVDSTDLEVRYEQGGAVPTPKEENGAGSEDSKADAPEANPSGLQVRRKDGRQLPSLSGGGDVPCVEKSDVKVTA
mmetsp:Transcript_100046/g.188317  ORF Transcript_100046/g.188317 Transcript_100046/m.188317 type:complete len:722 (-) Transcript_100046:152-2317(-)